MNHLDDQGQPLLRGFHHQRLVGRSADELIGICKGVLADGVLAREEITFLLRWMETNASYVSVWPFNVLYERFAAACEDGVITSDEEQELIGLLADLTGPGIAERGGNAPNEMLCDHPVPRVIFEDHRFVLTGAFACGKRSIVSDWIQSQGGAVATSVSRKVDYLLIGGVGSRDWLMSTHGTKIMAAADLKANGHHIAVIAERHALTGAAL